GEHLQRPSKNHPGQFVANIEAQYEYARMLMNDKLGRPLNGEPSQREQDSVVNFASRALGVEVKSYEEARQVLRGEILKGTPRAEVALRAADPNFKFYALKCLTGDQPYLALPNAEQGIAVVSFLGKIGFDQEVGVTVNLQNAKPEYRFMLGTWDHVSQLKS